MMAKAVGTEMLRSPASAASGAVSHLDHPEVGHLDLCYERNSQAEGHLLILDHPEPDSPSARALHVLFQATQDVTSPSSSARTAGTLTPQDR